MKLEIEYYVSGLFYKFDYVRVLILFVNNQSTGYHHF